jgi:hypothetical protein
MTLPYQSYGAGNKKNPAKIVKRFLFWLRQETKPLFWLLSQQVRMLSIAG